MMYFNRHLRFFPFHEKFSFVASWAALSALHLNRKKFKCWFFCVYLSCKWVKVLFWLKNALSSFIWFVLIAILMNFHCKCNCTKTNHISSSRIQKMHKNIKETYNLFVSWAWRSGAHVVLAAAAHKPTQCLGCCSWLQYNFIWFKYTEFYCTNCIN